MGAVRHLLLLVAVAVWAAGLMFGCDCAPAPELVLDGGSSDGAGNAGVDAQSIDDASPPDADVCADVCGELGCPCCADADAGASERCGAGLACFHTDFDECVECGPIGHPCCTNGDGFPTCNAGGTCVLPQRFCVPVNKPGAAP